MKKAVFKGERQGLYEGMTALLRTSDNDGKVLAQFDSIYLTFGERNPYAFGWWEFDESDFEEVSDE